LIAVAGHNPIGGAIYTLRVCRTVWRIPEEIGATFTT